VQRSNKGANERGAAYVEYAFLVALIAVVCMAAMTFFGESVSTRVTKSGSSVSAAN
jgi:Flp pilus assembly pilin Flp